MVVELDQQHVLSIGSSFGFDAEAIHPYYGTWAIPSDSVDHVTVRGTLEYLSGPQRVWFCNELHRVLKPAGTATLYLPYWTSPNAFADPYLQWPPITEMSLSYLCDQQFRSRNRLPYPLPKADFDISYGYSYASEWHVRSDAARDYATKHNVGIIRELVATLTKREDSAIL